MPQGDRAPAPLIAVVAAAVAIWLLPVGVAVAADVPDPARLERALDVPALIVAVVEPHAEAADPALVYRYVGWPAPFVLDLLLGQEWHQPGSDVEFRALDGYVSRIPRERFDQYPAYLVFGRADGGAFTIDNVAQNEKDVPLGPYYLVWDTIAAPGLLADGSGYWPYQVSEVLVSHAKLNALLPGNLADRYAEDAALTQKYCLNCHTINGYGGDKWPVDLARRAQEMSNDDFLRWVLTPHAVKPATTMPPLAEQRPQAERQALAQRIFDFLRAIPAASR